MLSKFSFSIRTFFFALMLVLIPASSFAGVFISVNIAPPPLPVYSQPYCPGPGYIWTPGYWAYGPEGYFWVPGTWVVAPFVGGLWTPGYWGWGDGLYAWHGGYWGTQVGFYGGVNYGYGYGGRGYEGGYWRGNQFNYNRSVNNVNVTNIHNVYNKTVINNVNITRVSYNGGNGGVQMRPSPQEQQAIRYKRQDALPVQMQHQQAAASNRMQLATVNHGAPSIAATPRPGAFQDRNVVHSERVGAPPARINQNTGKAPVSTMQPQVPVRTEQPNNHGNYNAQQHQQVTQPQQPRPTYNAQQPQQVPQTENRATPQQHQQVPPQAPRPAYNEPQQHQQVPQSQEQHSNAAPQQHQPAPQQQNMRPAPQPHPQSMSPEPRSNAQPQRQQSAPQQGAPHEQSAPHSQPAPHPQGGGQPHGEPHGEPHSEPHGGGGRSR